MLKGQANQSLVKNMLPFISNVRANALDSSGIWARVSFAVRGTEYITPQARLSANCKVIYPLVKGTKTSVNTGAAFAQCAG